MTNDKILIDALEKVRNDIKRYGLDEQFGLEENDYISEALAQYSQHPMEEYTSQYKEQIEGLRKDIDMALEREKLLQDEIKRIKGLVGIAWQQAIINCEVENGAADAGEKYISWKVFKSENNIE